MTIKHVFIVGVAKCGTTALSEWMVVNGLAEDRVPGEKEPYLYANDEPHAARSRKASLPLLDASAGYAFDPATVQRLPQHDTRLVLCLRNGFERMWSFYKMFKLDSLGGDQARDYFSSYQSEHSGTGRAPRETSTFSATVIRICQAYFPRRLHLIVEGYARHELEHLRTHTFMQRIEYELAFYLSRKQFPFFPSSPTAFTTPRYARCWNATCRPTCPSSASAGLTMPTHAAVSSTPCSRNRSTRHPFPSSSAAPRLPSTKHGPISMTAHSTRCAPACGTTWCRHGA